MRLAASNSGLSKGLLSALFDDNASLVTLGTDLLLLELAGAPKIRGFEGDCPPPMAACRRGYCVLSLFLDDDASLVTG